jgi:competence protein ComEC
LGDESGIPPQVQEAFVATGTSHIIAISGFNMAIIAGLFTLAFSRLLGRRWGIFAAMLGLGLYTALVGASASVLRAAIMGSFALVARQFGRRTGINILALTAAIMVGASPWPLEPGSSSRCRHAGAVLYAQPCRTADRPLAPPLPDRARRIAGRLAVLHLHPGSG